MTKTMTKKMTKKDKKWPKKGHPGGLKNQDFGRILAGFWPGFGRVLAGILAGKTPEIPAAGRPAGRPAGAPLGRGCRRAPTLAGGGLDPGPDDRRPTLARGGPFKGPRGPF